MIVRVFRAEIVPALRAEFEEDFRSVSLPFVRAQPGNVSATIGRPTKWAPDEYVLVSMWDDVEAIKAMAGEQWNEAHIPAGMERYIEACWVHHYEAFE